MIRNTRQREAILAVLAGASRPLTPQEVFDAAVSLVPGLGLRTVYRHLRELEAAFRVVGIDYPGQPLRYEMAGGDHHPHFICRRCNRVFDLPVEIPDVPVVVPEGFRLEGQETIFYGICKSCLESPEASIAAKKS